MRRLASLLVVLALGPAACGSPTQPFRTIALGEPFWLGLGETRVIADGATSVRFTAVEDSTCPADVFCVWEGDLMVRLAFAPVMADEAFVELHRNMEPRTATMGSYHVALLDALLPRDRAAGGRYRAQLVITVTR